MVSNYVCKKCDFIYPTDWYVGPNPRCTAGINDVHKHFEGKCPKCGKTINLAISGGDFTKKGITI